MTLYLSMNIDTGELELHTATTTRKPNEIIATNNNGTINIELIPETVSSIIEIEALTDIQTGKCITIDERTLKATIATSNNLCIGISLNSCITGEICKILTSGIYTLSSPIPDELTGVLFKQDNGSISIIQPDLFVQQIGYLFSNKIIINITLTPIYLMGAI